MSSSLLIFCPRASVGHVGFCNALSRGAIERGESVHLIHGEPELPLTWAAGASLELDLGDAFGQQARAALRPSTYLAMARWLRRHPVDRVYILASHPLAISCSIWWLLSGRKVAFHLHDPVPHSSQRGAAMVTRFNSVIARVPGLRMVSSSRHLAQVIAKMGWRKHPEQVAVVPIPIAMTPSGRPVAPRASRRTILMIGRVESYKAPERFIDAARRLAAALPDCRFVLAGSGDAQLLAELQAQAEGVGIELRLRRLGEEEFGALISSAVAVCMPYLDATNSGIAPNCFELGTPIIATAVGGLVATVEDEVNGLLCPPGDLDAFCAAIVRLAQDDALFDRLSAGAKRSAEACSPARVVGCIEAALAS